MKRHDISDSDSSLIEVVRILVLLQGAIALTSALEAAILGAAFAGPATLSLVLTAGGALLTLGMAAALGRRARWSRRLVIWLEIGWVLAAVVDLALAVFLARRPLEPVAILSRLVLPLAIVYVLRRPAVRAAFAAPPAGEPAVPEGAT